MIPVGTSAIVAHPPGKPVLDAGVVAPPGLEADGFGWAYRGRDRPALQGISFRLAPGRVLLVLGPSGSGKSTLARALAGLVPHVLGGTWWGRLTVGELDVAETPARVLGARVGLVFQDPGSQLVMARVEDDVAFGLENRGWPRPAMLDRVPFALDAVGLAGFQRRGTATLSGGEQQRLAIADVLAPAPRLLVFDEPTANLDPPGMQATLDQVAALAARREHTIVLVEHRLDAALPLADDVLLIDEAGRQLAFAPAGEVGPASVALLARTGAWIPRAWAGFQAPAGTATASDASGGPLPGRTGPSPRATVLRGDDLLVDYPADAAGSHQALDGVSLRVGRGERVALVGPNGAGKSSLLLTLAGLLRPTSGRVVIRDASGTEWDPARVGSAALATLVGLVFQDPELGFVARTVRGEVAASVWAASGRQATRRSAGGPVERTSGAATAAGPVLTADEHAGAEAVLVRFGLDHLADVDPFRLSQGEQRRLSLAALALRPPAALLLDEPTFGLDRRGTIAVLGLLDGLRADGQAQLLATHDPRLLPGCDRVLALEAGRLVFDGLPVAFLADPPYHPRAPWQDAGLTPSEAADVPDRATGGPSAPAADPTAPDPMPHRTA